MVKSSRCTHYLIGIASHDVNEIEDAYGPERKARDIITWSKDGMITVKFTVDGEVIKESTSLPGQVYVDTTWDRRPLQVMTEKLNHRE